MVSLVLLQLGIVDSNASFECLGAKGGLISEPGISATWSIDEWTPSGNPRRQPWSDPQMQQNPAPQRTKTLILTADTAVADTIAIGTSAHRISVVLPDTDFAGLPFNAVLNLTTPMIIVANTTTAMVAHSKRLIVTPLTAQTLPSG